MTGEEDVMEDDQPPLSLHTLPARQFYLTRRGKLFQKTTERYLRDDLGYGTMLVPAAAGGGGRKSKATIAGEITQLVPWTIEDVPALLDAMLGSHASCGRLAVVDTNALLHHMDVLEYLRDESGDDEEGGDDAGSGPGRRRTHHAIADAIVVPQTALEECRHRSLVMYQRATDLVRSSSLGGGSKGGKKRRRCVIVFADVHHVDTQTAAGSGIINDENDARLRKVADYYGRALRDYSVGRGGAEAGRRGIEVVFLSDDAASRQLAVREQPGGRGGGAPRHYQARSMREHVTLLQREDPTLHLLDLLAQFHAGPRADKRASGVAGDRPDGFAPQVASAALSRGLRTGRYYQGTYRAHRDTYKEGYVTICQGEDRVAVVVQGAQDTNRAVDGDIVAVEMFAVERWLGNPNEHSQDTENGHGAGHEKGKHAKEATTHEQVSGIAADTAEPAVRDTENIAEEVPVDDEGRLRRPTGRVVGIVRRNFSKNYCGSICTVDGATGAERDAAERHPHDVIAARHEREHPDGITSTVVFFSIDGRVPPILLRTTQRERLAGMRILVSVDSWPADSEYPLGHYVRTLGKAGTKDTETEVLLQEHRIPCDPFPAKVRTKPAPLLLAWHLCHCCSLAADAAAAKVLACLPPADYKIELEDGRADLRHLPVLSIDPPGCKDIDDALHCVELPNGNWEVGVHIADVTHYVEAGTAIDLEAANRSTSTYLVNKRLDMLPSLLTTDLCSLKGNVDR